MSAVALVSPAGSPPGRWPVIVNVVLFQAGWFACVLGAAHGWAVAGSLCVVAVAAVHLVLARRPVDEAKLLLCAAGIGLVFDSALLRTGALAYTSGHLPGAFGAALAPHWIVASWVLLATALNVSMRWLKGRYALAALLGAVAAPWSYWAGVRLGAAHFIDMPLALGLLAAGWALLMPLLLWLAGRFDGIASEEPRDA